MAIRNFRMNDVFPSGLLTSHYVGNSWYDGMDYTGVFIPYYNQTEDAALPQNLKSVNNDNRKDVTDFTFSVLDSVWIAYNALPSTERPAYFNMNKTTRYVGDGMQKVTYVVVVDVATDGTTYDVVSE
jgi:hypothetical protein